MPQPEPPDRVPRFSIAGVMLLTVAIAIVLGVLQAPPRFAPLTAVLILAGWVAFMVANPEEKSRTLICWLWPGLALPASLAGLALEDAATVPRIVLADGVAVWLGPFTIWSIIRYFPLPSTSALLVGCLGLTTLNSLLCAFSFGALGAKGVGEEFSLATLLAVVGILSAGLITAAVHGLAMRESWRRSYRNPLAWTLVVLGPVLMVAGFAVLVRYR